MCYRISFITHLVFHSFFSIVYWCPDLTSCNKNQAHDHYVDKWFSLIGNNTTSFCWTQVQVFDLELCPAILVQVKQNIHKVQTKLGHISIRAPLFSLNRKSNLCAWICKLRAQISEPHARIACSSAIRPGVSSIIHGCNILILISFPEYHGRMYILLVNYTTGSLSNVFVGFCFKFYVRVLILANLHTIVLGLAATSYLENLIHMMSFHSQGNKQLRSEHHAIHMIACKLLKDTTLFFSCQSSKPKFTHNKIPLRAAVRQSSW